MNPFVIYQITRYGVPSSAGHYRSTGEFIQVFPHKSVYPDKMTWLRAWDLFGDEQVIAYVRPTSGRSAFTPVLKKS